MTTQELVPVVSELKWWLADRGYTSAAQEYEDAETRLRSFTPEMCRQYADFIVPPGKAGRMQTVLNSPVIARALALLAWLLRNVE